MKEENWRIINYINLHNVFFLLHESINQSQYNSIKWEKIPHRLLFSKVYLAPLSIILNVNERQKCKA